MCDYCRAYFYGGAGAGARDRKKIREVAERQEIAETYEGFVARHVQEQEGGQIRHPLCTPTPKHVKASLSHFYTPEHTWHSADGTKEMEMD